jgi:hypothetical protein
MSEESTTLECKTCDTSIAEPEAAKVIVVTEAPIGDDRPVERRYAAEVWGHQVDGSLAVGHAHATIENAMRGTAGYAKGAWLSVREDGSLVPDGTQRALAIAKRALEAVVAVAKGGTGDIMVTPEQVAADALDEIYGETE